jgi:hypothetical protein
VPFREEELATRANDRETRLDPQRQPEIALRRVLMSSAGASFCGALQGELKIANNPDAKSFEAWLDKKPGANNTLHVKGKVPTLGWTVPSQKSIPRGSIQQFSIWS